MTTEHHGATLKSHNKVTKKGKTAKPVLRKYNGKLIAKEKIEKDRESYRQAREECIQAIHVTQPGFVTVRSHIDKELRVDQDFFRWGVSMLKLSPISDLHYCPVKLKSNGFLDYLTQETEEAIQMYEGIIIIARNLADQQMIERDVGLIVRKDGDFFWLSVTKDISVLWDRKARPVVIHDFSFNPHVPAFCGDLCGALCFIKNFQTSLSSFCNVIHHLQRQDDSSQLPSNSDEFEKYEAQSQFNPTLAPYFGVSSFQLISCEWYKNLALDRPFDFYNMLGDVADCISFNFDEFIERAILEDEFQKQLACYNILRLHNAPEYRLHLEHLWLSGRSSDESVWYKITPSGQCRILTIREAASQSPFLRKSFPMLEYYHLGVRPFGTKIRSRGIAQKIAELSGYDWDSLSKKQKNRLVRIDWISVSATVHLSNDFKWVSPFRSSEYVYFPECVLDVDTLYCPESSKKREILHTNQIQDCPNFCLVPNMIMKWRNFADN